jgi:preprotein translocase subunit SecG
MFTLFVVLHVIVCVVLCVVVLLQSSKGGGLAGAFGGGGGVPQQIFGSRGMTTLLHKLTIYCAIGFFITSASIFALTARRGPSQNSIVQEAVQSGELEADVTPAAPADGPLLPEIPVDQPATGGEGTQPATGGTEDDGGSTGSADDTGGGQ